MKLIKLKEESGYTFYCTENIKKEEILTPGQGLYGWINKSEFDIFIKNGYPEDGIKYGQYGSDSEIDNKTPLITTVQNFKGGINKEPIVFVYHKSFNIINENNPSINAKLVENKLKKINVGLISKETKSTEVFKISPSDYDLLVEKELKFLLSDSNDRFPKLNKLRWYQKLFIFLYERLFCDTNLYLLAFSCGKGKSITITKLLVDIYHKIVGDVFLITTKPSTLYEYADQKKLTGYFYSKDIQEKYHISYLRDDINDNFDYDKIKREAGDKKIIFISSKQFLDKYLSSLINQTEKDLSKFNDSFKDACKTKISLVISDEGHWGANTEITNKIHSSDIISELNSIFSRDVKILYSTATPGSLIFKYNLNKDYQFYLDDEIEESFFNFLYDLNVRTYNEFIDKISNQSSNREIISEFIQQYLQENFK